MFKSVPSGLSVSPHILRNRPPIVSSNKLIQINKVRTISDVVSYQYCFTWSVRQLDEHRLTVMSLLHHVNRNMLWICEHCNKSREYF